MAETVNVGNVNVQGNLAHLLLTARCNSCQAGDNRCVVIAGDERCATCSAASKECIFTRSIVVSAPSSMLPWEVLTYQRPITNIQVPNGTTFAKFQEILAPFNPDGPHNAIVPRRQNTRDPPPPLKPAPPPLSPAAQQLQNGLQSAPIAGSSTPNGLTHTIPPPESPVPNKRARLRSAVSLDNLVGAKGDACDDCRKHKRKCLPSHKKQPISPAKPSPAQSEPGAHRFACRYDDCHKDFTFMGDLQRHTREIHKVDLDGNPVVPHHCPVEDCTRNIRPFARRDNLRQHLEKRHGMSPEEADASLSKVKRSGRKSNAS